MHSLGWLPALAYLAVGWSSIGAKGCLQHTEITEKEEIAMGYMKQRAMAKEAAYDEARDFLVEIGTLEENADSG